MVELIVGSGNEGMRVNSELVGESEIQTGVEEVCVCEIIRTQQTHVDRRGMF